MEVIRWALAPTGAAVRACSEAMPVQSAPARAGAWLRSPRSPITALLKAEDHGRHAPPSSAASSAATSSSWNARLAASAAWHQQRPTPAGPT